MLNLEPITIKQIESKTASIIANGTNVSAQISANIVEILPMSKIVIFNGFLTSVFLLQKAPISMIAISIIKFIII